MRSFFAEMNRILTNMNSDLRQLSPIDDSSSRLENMSLLLLVMGFHHGAQSVEFREIDEVFRVGERINGTLFEYPHPPIECRTKIYSFYKTICGSRNLWQANLEGRTVELTFSFFAINGLDIGLRNGEDLIDRCENTLDRFWKAMGEVPNRSSRS